MKFEYNSADESIYAPATPAGKSALAIVRISGKLVPDAFLALCDKVPDARMATLATVADSKGQTIDQAIILYFPSYCSPTGEDAGEFHLHGNTLIVESLALELEALGFRLAAAGEFTRRSVLAGKLDLTQAEALADLIDAETSRQRSQAIAQLYGGLANPVLSWRDQLLDALALVEADIDFSDEGDVGDNLSIRALTAADKARRQIQAVLAQRAVGEGIREGFRVVIAGPPNAGKSTLLNHLVGRDAAIVTDRPGTTRDVIEVKLDLDGLPIRLMDTAGIRETDDQVEQMGISRANYELNQADVVLWLDRATGHESLLGSVPSELSCHEVVYLSTQIDRLDVRSCEAPSMVFGMPISAVTGEGIDELLELLKTKLIGHERTEGLAITRLRHREALTSTLQCLERLPLKDGALDDWSAIALWAEDLRLAVYHLGTITGHARADDVLDRVFTSFCIGK